MAIETVPEHSEQLERNQNQVIIDESLTPAENGSRVFVLTTIGCYALAELISQTTDRNNDILGGTRMMCEALSLTALASAAIIETHAIRLRNQLTNLLYRTD